MIVPETLEARVWGRKSDNDESQQNTERKIVTKDTVAAPKKYPAPLREFFMPATRTKFQTDDDSVNAAES